MQSRPIYSVSAFTREVRTLLEESYPVIRIEGEVSNLTRSAAGHLYFTLKDDSAQLRCAFFRNRVRLSPGRLAEGMQVVVTAQVSLYEARGDFQLIVQAVVEAGEGLLRQRFEALKQQLSGEGLFATQHKRPLPAMPGRIGIITSPRGAAIHDIITTFRRRFPAIHLLLYPVPVQGAEAAPAIAKALALASQRNECDALILARGGGSLEDLWPFNEEQVARALFACTLPVVSAVGHETDFTIADMVADVRAPTPTGAAELLSPDRATLREALRQMERRLHRGLRSHLDATTQRLDQASCHLPRIRQVLEVKRLLELRLRERMVNANISAVTRWRMIYTRIASGLHRPDATVAHQQRLIGQLRHRLIRAMRQHIEKALQDNRYATGRLLARNPRREVTGSLERCNRHTRHCMLAIRRHLAAYRAGLEQQARELHALSPLATLARGFATLHNAVDGHVIKGVGEVREQETIEARLRDGRLDCVVTAIHPDNTD